MRCSSWHASKIIPKRVATTDDVEIKEVAFEDGLFNSSCKVVPEHHARKDYL